MLDNKIFKLLFETASEGLVLTNKLGEIVLVNPRLLELFGYTKEELLNQKLEILIPEKYKKQHVGQRQNYQQKPKRKSMGAGRDLKGLRKDGTVFPIEVSLNHVDINEEKHFVALVTDITERKNIEEKIHILNKTLEDKIEERTRELKESEQLYSLIAQNFPNGTINVFDRDLNYEFVHGQELHKAGINREKLYGTNYIERLPNEIKEEVEENLMQVFKGEPNSFELKLKKGVYELYATPLSYDNGIINKILVVEQNITNKKKAEENMQKALHKERQLSELKSRFVSMASHEFRTPLSSILTSSQLIHKYVDNNDAGKIPKHTQRIQNSVQNLVGILDDFLSISKLEEGKLNPRYKELNIKLFLEQNIEELQELSKKDQIIQLKYQGEEMLNGDPNIFKLIITNLISNAIKYSGENSLVEVNAVNENARFILSVKDQGIGIPKEDQKHLFERFFRAKNASNISGTGLGLNIVHKYIELLNGEINFESVPNEGTKFIITIPDI